MKYPIQFPFAITHESWTIEGDITGVFIDSKSSTFDDPGEFAELEIEAIVIYNTEDLGCLPVVEFIEMYYDDLVSQAEAWLIVEAFEAEEF
jgi:hypothetical protein